MTVIVFFLAEDLETRIIVDDGFLSAGENAPKLFVKSTHWLAERKARGLRCQCTYLVPPPPSRQDAGITAFNNMHYHPDDPSHPSGCSFS